MAVSKGGNRCGHDEDDLPAPEGNRNFRRDNARTPIRWLNRVGERAL